MNTGLIPHSYSERPLCAVKLITSLDLQEKMGGGRKNKITLCLLICFYIKIFLIIVIPFIMLPSVITEAFVISKKIIKIIQMLTYLNIYQVCLCWVPLQITWIVWVREMLPWYIFLLFSIHHKCCWVLFCSLKKDKFM